MRNIAIIGSSGAIGGAMTQHLARLYPEATLNAFSRKQIILSESNIICRTIDFDNEDSIASAATLAAADQPIDLVVVTSGFLHDNNTKPEKALRDLSKDNFIKVFNANTVTPAIFAKYFVPKLNKLSPAIFAALSARVGSISDNQLGGWYAYRASKAALNMIIKNLAIETARINKKAIIVGLHPGTVDSPLSKPFQGSVPKGKLFTPEDVAVKLYETLKKLSPQQSGKCFAWDGQEIEP